MKWDFIFCKELVIILEAIQEPTEGGIFVLALGKKNNAPQVISVGCNYHCMVGKYMVLEVGNILGWKLEEDKGILIGRSIGRIYFSAICLVGRVDKHMSVGERDRVGQANIYVEVDYISVGNSL